MNTFKILLTIFVVTAWAPIHSQEIAKVSFRVGVRVTTDNELFRTYMASYTYRELRSLGDVIVVDTLDTLGEVRDYFIDVFVVEQFYKDGQKTGGVATGASFTKYIDCGGPYFESAYLGRLVQIGTSQDLDGACSIIIAYFDSNVLEPARKSKSNVKKDR